MSVLSSNMLFSLVRVKSAKPHLQVIVLILCTFRFRININYYIEFSKNISNRISIDNPSFRKNCFKGLLSMKI